MAQNKKIIWSPAALEEKFYILDFWIQHNKSATFSIKLDSAIEYAVDLLSAHPYTGYQYSDNLRAVVVREYQIFYEVTQTSVFILCFWDGRQNPEKLKERLE